jgi:predicted small lipoprotein YifL
MRTRLPALLLAALTLAGCGKYGPPVRSAPADTGAVAEAEAAPQEADPDERDAGEEAPR